MVSRASTTSRATTSGASSKSFASIVRLHYDDAVARAHGYRGLVAPVAMTPLWAMPAYWSPGEPVFYGPELRRKQPGGIRTDLPIVYPRGVNTATEWEYFEPLYPGDKL